jgi:hypothetical protein
MAKTIIIRPVLNGWQVQVGCKEVVFEDLKYMVSEIERYYKFPKEVEKWYLENAKNKESSIPEPPECPRTATEATMNQAPYPGEIIGRGERPL